MISLWRCDDVVVGKLVKRQASSTQIHISIDLVSQIIIFLVRITNMAYFFPI